MSVAERITRHYGGDWNAGAGQGNIPADGHSKADRSVSVKDAPDKQDGILVHCHGAGDWQTEMDRFRRDGLVPQFEARSSKSDKEKYGFKLKPGQKIVQSWDWRKDGELLYRTHRIEPGPSGRGKEFRYDRPNGKGGWISGRGEAEHVPYRRDDLIAQAATASEIFMAEGERKADKIASWGLVATSSKHWRPEFGSLIEGATIFILPDNDQAGRDLAKRTWRNVTAAGASAYILELPDLPPAGDILDWTGTRQDLLQLIDLAVTALPPPWLNAEDATDADAAGLDPELPSLPFFWFDEAKPNLEANDFVQGLLTNTAMSVVYGPSNCGKTFFILDVALHVAWGHEWRGKAVDRGAVVYLSLEGSQGIQNRIVAFRQFHGLEKSQLPFVWMPEPINLLHEEANVHAVIELVQHVTKETGLPVRMVIVDTLSRAMAGGNENAGEDMTSFVGHCDQIRHITGAHVCIVHHSGKDEAKGARGHTSLRAATDTEIEIKQDPEIKISTVRISKQRDLEALEPFAFALQKTTLGINRRGDDVTSCVVIEAEHSVPLARDAVRLSPQESDALETLDSCLRTAELCGATARNNDDVAHVAQDTWRQVLKDREIISRNDEHVARSQYARIRKNLIDKGKIVVSSDEVWRAQQ